LLYLDQLGVFGSQRLLIPFVSSMRIGGLHWSLLLVAHSMSKLIKIKREMLLLLNEFSGFGSYC